MKVFYDYVANADGAFRLVFESDLTSEPAVREQVDRVTRECANEIAKVIHGDTGLPDEASQLLAVSLVGMAQVSARYWVDSEGELELGSRGRPRGRARLARHRRLPADRGPRLSPTGRPADRLAMPHHRLWTKGGLPWRSRSACSTPT